MKLNLRWVAVLLICLQLFSCKKDLLHWQNVAQLDSHSKTDRLAKIIFKDANTGYILGGNWYVDAVILTTNDGGNTWARQSYPLVGQLLMGGTVAPSGTVYGIGFEGKMLNGNGTNSNWQFTQMEHYWFRDLSFKQPDSAILIGGISFNSGMIQHIDSNGHVFMRDSLPYQLNQIKMVSASTGYICGYGLVLKTTDGGMTWAMLDISGDNFYAMCIHGEEIWVCGYNGSIFHTLDGGKNWQNFRNGNDLTQESYRLTDILFTDNMHGWAVGENGLVVYSRDGGQHWSKYDQFTTSTLYSIAQNANGNLFVCGENGSVYRILPQ